MLKSVVRNLLPTSKSNHSVIDRVLQEQLTYLEKAALTELVEVALKNEQTGIEGLIVEAGCALGGSAIALASVKTKKRGLFVYDVFGMIPSPSEQDDQDVHERYAIIRSGAAQGIGEHQYYGYEDNLFEKVYQTFIRFGLRPEKNQIHLIKGLFEDTLQIRSPIALAHIDCDWYESVMTCLTRIEPQLVPGGTLVIDDYYAWSGCRKAVDEFFKDRRSEFDFLEKRRLHIVKR